MQAGVLEIQLMANISRLSRDMTQATGMVGGAMSTIERSATMAMKALSALGIGVGMAGVTAIAKAAIDAADHLNDLSKSTSLAVETLAGLRLAAKQTGSALDGTAAAINKLTVNMGKDAEKFRALGISARDPLEAFKQLSDIFVAIQDPQQRAAMAAEALGKSWASAAPLLAEGGKNIGDMVKKGAELSGMTGELARQADAFNDKLAELAGNGGGINAVLTQMLPLLNATADGLIEGGKSTTLWSAAGAALTEILRVLVVVGGNVLFVLKGIGTEAIGIGTQLAALAHGDLQAFVAIGKQMKADAAANRIAFDAWEKSIMAVGAAARSTAIAIDASDQVSRRAASEASAQVRKFLEHAEQKKRADREIEEARRAAERARRLAWDDEFESLSDELEVLKKQREELERIEKLFARNAVEFSHNAVVAMADSAGVMVEAGMRVQEQWSSMWTDIGDRAGDFFADLVMNGKSAFDNLKRWVKELLAQMIKIFATRWILQMGAAGAAASGNSALANTLGSTASSYGTNAVGGAALGAAATFGEGVMMGWASGVAAPASQVGIVGAAGEGLGAWASTLGATGWGLIIVAAIAVVAAILANRGGGPKAEGSFVDSFDATGASSGAYAVSSEYGNRFVGGTALDSALQAPVHAIRDAYLNLITRLGGVTPGSFGFGLGVSNDPAGDARSRVFGNAMVGGRGIFDGALDVDDKEVDAAIALTSKRAILAALQATDFHDELDKIFAGAGDVARLTGEQIDAIIAQAREMFAVIEGIKGLGLTGLDVEALRAFSLEGESIGQTFQRVGGAWMQLVDAFTSEESKLGQARWDLDQLNASLVEFGYQMPINRDHWLDVMSALDLSTESGRELWSRMMALAPAFDAVTDAAAAANDRLEELHRILGTGTDLSQAVGRFQAGNSWAQGMSADQLIAALRTIQDEDFLGYTSANQTLINSILDLARGIDRLDTTIATGPSASTLFSGDLTNANVRPGPTWEWNGRTWVNTASTAGGGAGQGLSGYLDSLLLGNNSPLDPRQQLAEAQRQYEDMLRLAQAGDLTGLNGLQGAHQAYIDLARQMWGSSGQFVDIFRRTFDEVSGVAGSENYNTRMLDSASQQLDTQKTMVVELREVRQLLMAIRDDQRQGTEVLADEFAEGSEKVAQATKLQGLERARR